MPAPKATPKPSIWKKEPPASAIDARAASALEKARAAAISKNVPKAEHAPADPPGAADDPPGTALTAAALECAFAAHGGVRPTYTARAFAW